MKHLNTTQKILLVFAVLLFVGGNSYLGYEALNKNAADSVIGKIQNPIEEQIKIYSLENPDSETVSHKVTADGNFSVDDKNIVLIDLVDTGYFLSRNQLAGQYAENKIQFRSGTAFFEAKNDFTLQISKASDLEIPRGVVGFYNSDSEEIVIISGSLNYHDEKIGHNESLVKVADDFSKITFDRENFSKSDYSEIIKTLAELDKLPKELEDLTPPEIVIISPKNNLETTENEIGFYLRTEPKVGITINDNVYTADDSGELKVMIPVENGKNYFEIRAVDEWGNETSHELVVERIEKEEKVRFPVSYGVDEGGEG